MIGRYIGIGFKYDVRGFGPRYAWRVQVALTKLDGSSGFILKIGWN